MDAALIASTAAAIALPMSAAAWLTAWARRRPVLPRDVQAVRITVVLAWIGALGWVLWTVPWAYSPLWHADALLRAAQARNLWLLPAVIGGFAWATALLLGRLLRTLQQRLP